jgi:methionyl-tRNA formyltransferase
VAVHVIDEHRPVRGVAMSNHDHNNAPSVLYFGMPCALSAPVLGAIESGGRLAGMVTPARRLGKDPWRMVPRRPNTWSPGRASESRPQMEVPHYLVGDLLDPDLRAALNALKPDMIVVACFPWRIPDDVVAAAGWLAVNVHPSILPRHRGPDPLFWTFQSGDRDTGVSVHMLTSRLDDGPLLLQHITAVHPGEQIAGLERRLGAIGGELVASLLARFSETLPRIVPHQALPSYEGMPGSLDLRIDPSWTVEHARMFIDGVATSHGPLFYSGRNGEPLLITGTGGGDTSVEIVLANGSLQVQTTPAVVSADDSAR